MILVLDCNIWISLTLNRELNIIANLFEEGAILASCEELRKEIAEVLKRPKFARFISSSDVLKVIELHDIVTKVYQTGKLVKVTADIKDDYLFALASKAKADYFITGDKLLLNLANYKGTQIITLSAFKQLRKGM